MPGRGKVAQIAVHNLQAEESLLGSMLLSRVAIDEALLRVTAEDFYKPAHQSVFAAIVAIHSRGENADPVTVQAVLVDQGLLDQIGGAHVLVDLMANTPSIGNAPQYAAIVAETSLLRQLSAIGGEIQSLARDSANGSAEVFQRAHDLLGRVQPGQSAGGFTRIDVAALMEKGVPAPTMVHDWLYAGGLHSLQAEPGVGKSWIALWIAIQIMLAGQSVVYLDEEGGEELVTERLVALGADRAVVAERFHYFAFEARSWDAGDVAALAAVLAKAAPVGMGVLDSLPDFLAAANLDENSSMDVTRFVHRILPPFRDAGAALVVLDHLNRPPASSSKKGGPSRYARGSGAKLGKVHGTILVETVKEFDADTSGSVRLWKTKDRRGRIGLPKLTQQPLLLDVTVADGHVAFTEGEAPAFTWQGPSECMQAVEELLKSVPRGEFSKSKLKAAMNGAGHRFRDQTIYEAAEQLAAQGRLSHHKGKRNADIYSWLPEMQVDAQELPDPTDDEPSYPDPDEEF